MEIHEYQGKQLMSRYQIPVPQGIVCTTADEAASAAERLQGQTARDVLVVKAQVHAGGRGRAGGVRVIRGGRPADVRTVASELLGRTLVTHQTGSQGVKIHKVYVEAGLDIARELYLALLVDRDSRRVALIASAEGGMDIEQVARQYPDRIFRISIDPLLGVTGYQARYLARVLSIRSGSPDPTATQRDLTALLGSLYRLFVTEDCTLCEINPLVVSKEGGVWALDAKISFDNNAAFRHPEWKEWSTGGEEDPIEAEAHRAGLSYVALDGNIGCLVNGAGLAMSTMDIIQHHGGTPANFLDVGGGASPEAVRRAFELIMSSRQVRGIYVNIFGGIVKCDVVASGIIAATRELALEVPLVVRLEGTNMDQGRAMLAESGLRITTAHGMDDGARKIVAAIAG